MDNLKLLSDDDLINLYRNTKETKAAILKELNNRGIKVTENKIIRSVKTGRQIETFLKAAGFTYLASKRDMANPYGSGCGCFVKEIKGNKDYVYQINGVGISEIESINEPVLFSENGCDPVKTPMYRYSKEYPDFYSMVRNESKRGVFDIALKNYNIPFLFP